MKYKYNGQWVDLSIKALDSMPVGTIVEFDGQISDIPNGWQQDTSNILYEDSTGTMGDITLSDNVDNYNYFLVSGVDKDNASSAMNMIMFKCGNTIRGTETTISGSDMGAWTTRTYTYSGKNLTFSSQYYTTIAHGWNTFNYNNFIVRKIIGYK